ncbi:MAG: DNA primase [Firmicutes bacterium]|nr:DNA primase [Bacillota bacterium]
MIGQDELQSLREKVDIVDVISSYIPLTQKGRNFFGVCPFHDDTNPSMSVSKEKQIYTCFACGASGNVFKFIMDYEHINFREAISKVATMAGVDLHLSNSIKPTVQKNQKLYDCYDIASKFYQNNLHTKSGQAAFTYLKNRNMDDACIKEFGIGYATKENHILTDLLSSKQIPKEELLKSGLVVENEYGLLDIYKDRVMFPLWDLEGRVVGFSGRLYNGEKQFKYINSKESEIFKKGELLYNYHRARDEARKAKQIILMEGFMDVIRAYTVGIKHVVATMGTAVTREQASHLKRLSNDIIICFDGDEAGAKGTASCIEELGKLGVTPKVVRLEENLDPDEYIQRYGVEAFQKKLENPMSMMDFKLSYYKKSKDLTDSADLTLYVKEVISELAKMKDEVMREVTLKKIQEESGLDINFLKEQLMKLEKKEKTTVVPPVLKEKKEGQQKRVTKYEKAEKNLIYYMLRDVSAIKIYEKKVTFMPTKEFRNLAREICCFYKEYGRIELADFMTYIGQNETMQKALSEILSLSLKEEAKEEELLDYAKVIREYSIKDEIKRLQKLMIGASTEEKTKLATKIVELRLGDKKYD